MAGPARQKPYGKLQEGKLSWGHQMPQVLALELPHVNGEDAANMIKLLIGIMKGYAGGMRRNGLLQTNRYLARVGIVSGMTRMQADSRIRLALQVAGRGKSVTAERAKANDAYVTIDVKRPSEVAGSVYLVHDGPGCRKRSANPGRSGRILSHRPIMDEL